MTLAPTLTQRQIPDDSDKGDDDRDEEEQDDPFSMFGEEEGEEGDERDENDYEETKDDASHDPTRATASSSLHQFPPQRDPANGFNLYHAGTEYALLHHVRNSLSPKTIIATETTTTTTTTTTIARYDRILKLVDDFCYQRHWMMHIGPDKGQILDQFLKDRVKHYFESQQQQKLLQPPQQRQRPFLLVEVGTYCGYSTARLLRTLLQQQLQREEEEEHGDWFHIVTVDVDPMHTSVARQLHQLAMVDNEDDDNRRSNQHPNITYITLDLTTTTQQTLASRVKEELTNYAKAFHNNTTEVSIDVLFLDHDKDLYKRDLQALEESGLIRQQTAVAADNVVFFQLQDYVQHMRNLQQRGVVQTQTILSQVEYIGEYERQQQAKAPQEQEQFWQDGLELSVYLQDPMQANTTTKVK